MFGEEALLIFQKILSNLSHDGWKIETLGSGWHTAIKDNHGLLFWVYLPNQPILPPPSNSKIEEWEGFIFCPEGLNSRDLDQVVLRNIQSWFIDLQTGIVFPYPPNPKQKTWEWLLSYLNFNNQSSSVKSLPAQNDNSITPQPQIFKPYITMILAALNVCIFILMTLVSGSINEMIQTLMGENEKILISFGAKVNELILQGQIWRFFTSMFIHIGFIHLAFNIYALWILGIFCEERFGHRRFLLIYLLSGIGGSVASFFFVNALSAGASGAIFGILGALVAYAWKQPHLWKSGLGKNLIIVILVNLGLSIIQPQIDIYAHLGGMLFGLILGFIFP